jgi:hypothetical protein
MKIEYVHASKFGNGAMVAEELRTRMASRGIEVLVHHVGETDPTSLPPADLYLFSSPGRMGKPIRSMRRFLKDLRLPVGARYALLTTEMAPQPDKKTGRMPTEEGKGLVEVAEEKVQVTGLKGPLEEGWRQKVDAFADRLPVTQRA